MKKDDTCYYMSITKEENSAFVVNQNQQNQNADPATGKDGVGKCCTQTFNGMLRGMRCRPKQNENCINLCI